MGLFMHLCGKGNFRKTTTGRCLERLRCCRANPSKQEWSRDPRMSTQRPKLSMWLNLGLMSWCSFEYVPGPSCKAHRKCLTTSEFFLLPPNTFSAVLDQRNDGKYKEGKEETPRLNSSIYPNQNTLGLRDTPLPMMDTLMGHTNRF